MAGAEVHALHVYMPQQKYYAVHNGRQGTQIYQTWEEVRPPVPQLPPDVRSHYASASARFAIDVADEDKCKCAPECWR